MEWPFCYVREDFYLGSRFRNLDDRMTSSGDGSMMLPTAMHATTRRVAIMHRAEERARAAAAAGWYISGGAAARHKTRCRTKLQPLAHRDRHATASLNDLG